MIVVPALAGLGAGLGAFVLIVGVRGVPVRPPGAGTVVRSRLLADPGSVAVTVVGFVVVLLATRWVVAAAGSAVAAHRLWQRRDRSRDNQATVTMAEAVAAWAEMLRDTLAAAAGIEEAVTVSAPVAPLVIRPSVLRLAARLRHESLAVALRGFADDVAEPTADLVVSALAVAGTGTARDLVPLLGALADSARRRATMVLRVEAGRARLRTAVRVVTGFTAAFAGGMVLLNRPYLAPYDDALGQLTLLVVLGVFAGALWQLDRMATIAAPARVLARTGVTGSHA